MGRIVCPILGSCGRIDAMPNVSLFRRYVERGVDTYHRAHNEVHCGADVDLVALLCGKTHSSLT